jgi:hypothetical protein
MSDRGLRRRATVLAAAALVLATSTVVSYYSGDHSAGAVVGRVLTAAAAPMALIVALVLVYGRVLRLGSAGALLVVVSGGAAVAALAFYSLSFGVGVDDSDAWRPTGLLRDATSLALYLSLPLGAVAVGIVAARMLATTTLSRRAAVLLTGVCVLVGTPTALVAVLLPQTPVLAAIVVLVLTALAGPVAPRQPATRPFAITRGCGGSRSCHCCSPSWSGAAG